MDGGVPPRHGSAPGRRDRLDPRPFVGPRHGTRIPALGGRRDIRHPGGHRGPPRPRPPPPPPHPCPSAPPGGSMSACDIVTALYFHVLRVDPANSVWPDRDRFVISKGHACPVLYAALAERGFLPVEELMTFRRINSRLQGHPEYGTPPGVGNAAGAEEPGPLSPPRTIGRRSGGTSSRSTATTCGRSSRGSTRRTRTRASPR